MNFLRRFLPNTVAVGTGFIKDGNNLSTQIDILIYNPSFPVYFKESDFVIIQPKSVLGMIEVKSNPNKSQIGTAIIKASKNGMMIDNDQIFNGLFIYGGAINEENIVSVLKEEPQEGILYNALNEVLLEKNAVNHIVDLDGIFIRRWQNENYRCYPIKNLSVSYFFSNLLERIDIMMGIYGIPEPMRNHLYPIKNGKESRLAWKVPSHEE